MYIDTTIPASIKESYSKEKACNKLFHFIEY